MCCKVSYQAASLLLTGFQLSALIKGSHGQCPSLIWSDEFDGTVLDTTKWTNMVGNGCDLGEGMCGWGNNEWQYYTDGGENVQVSNGTLKIQARYEADTERYTSARIRTLGKADFDLTQPVRIEARMKMPSDSYGLWPAFWMMPSQMEISTWPRGGEIDIMEFIGKEPNTTYGVMHYGKKWNDKSQKGGLVKFHEHAGNDFHVFALEKKPYSMTWSVDGYEYMTLFDDIVEPKFEWPFEGVFHFILNLAVGGNWPEYPNPTTRFPNQLEVDYIRVYDLTDAPEPTPTIVGDTLVRVQAQQVQYCIEVGSLQAHTDYDSFIEWTVPEGATYTSEATGDGDIPENCINVDFGTQSGYVQAKLFFNCGRNYDFSITVEVQDYYGAEFVLLGPDADQDETTYSYSTGNYSVLPAQGEDPPTVVYQRNLLEVYDHIYLETNALTQPNLYVESAKKFYMDAFSATAAPCTRFWIQLEDSSVATADNYPNGRHSRYLAFLPKGPDGLPQWHRLEFDYFDQPDLDFAGPVDRVVLLIDSFVQRSDTYYLRNLVSAAAGAECGNTCEPLSESTCQAAAKSEEGACNDGFNNDGFGWNGDGPVDCEDSDCWGRDPVCLATTPAPTPAAEEICYDGIDNDGNGLVDCDDVACGSSIACGSWSQPECSLYPGCAEHVGDCCPTPLGEYRDCCNNDTPASCSVHPACAALGLTGDCCPGDGGNLLSCCQPDLCISNPKCSGLEGACCPTNDGVFLECCEDRPETCRIHPQCDALGLSGQCCPTPDGVFLDCCEASRCDAHPACSGLSEDCCPTADGIYLDCCNLDTPVFAGFTGRVVQSQKLEAVPASGKKEAVAASSLENSSSWSHSQTLGVPMLLLLLSMSTYLIRELL